MNPRNTELEAIRTVADKYVKGCHTGNIGLIRSAFHPQAMMYGVSDGNLVAGPIEALYAYLEANDPPAKTGEPHQCFISDIRYEGAAAIVEIVQESCFGQDYINYFQLLKVNAEWLIVSKSYSATPSKQSMRTEKALEEAG